MDIQFASTYDLLVTVLTFFFGHFLVLAGLAYGVVWWQCSELFGHRRIQLRPRQARPWTELQHSTISILIFALLLCGLWAVSEAGFTRVYFVFAEHGVVYFVFSIVAMAVVHDTYYYFAHRFMHHPKVFRHVHKVHHSFSNPTPFASYAFHPLEALIEVAWIGPLVLIMPIHPAAFAIYVVILTIFNVISHLGYEFYRPGVAKWFITSTHHNMHHAGSKGHYMLYFNLWDRLLGSNAVDYEARIREINARPAAQPQASDVELVGAPI